jgi:hypothetical protein
VTAERALDHHVDAGILEICILKEVAQNVTTAPSWGFLARFSITRTIVWSGQENIASIEPFDPYAESFIVRSRQINDSVLALFPLFL